MAQTEASQGGVCLNGEKFLVGSEPGSSPDRRSLGVLFNGSSVGGHARGFRCFSGAHSAFRSAQPCRSAAQVPPPGLHG